MNKPSSRARRNGFFLMIGCLVLIGYAHADPTLRFMGVTATDSYQILDKKLFSSAEITGRSGQKNNNDFARWAAFPDLKVLGVSVSHAHLHTRRYGGTVSRQLSIWLNSEIDFYRHVDELSRTFGKPNEIDEEFSNQASSMAVWSKSSEGVRYELMLQGGIAKEEAAAIVLTARYDSNKLQGLPR